MWINNIIYIEAHYVNKYIGWVFSSSNIAIVTTVIGQSRGGGEGLYQLYTNCCLQLIVNCEAIINSTQTAVYS